MRLTYETYPGIARHSKKTPKGDVRTVWLCTRSFLAFILPTSQTFRIIVCSYKDMSELAHFIRLKRLVKLDAEPACQ